MLRVPNKSMHCPPFPHSWWPPFDHFPKNSQFFWKRDRRKSLLFFLTFTFTFYHFPRIPKLFWQRDQRVPRSLCFLDRDSEHGLLLYVSTYILSWTTIFSEVVLHVSTFFLSWTTTSCECSFLVMDYNLYKCLISFEVFLSLGYQIQSSTSRTRLEFHFSWRMTYFQ